MKFGKLVGGIAVIALMCFVGPASAYIWTEAGDAGELPGTAQGTFGTGPLTEITGDLEFDIVTGIYGVDLYRIRITDASLFVALTSDGAANVSDPVLWLFDDGGHGVYMNDDTAPANLQSTLPPVIRWDHWRPATICWAFRGRSTTRSVTSRIRSVRSSPTT